MLKPLLLISSLIVAGFGFTAGTTASLQPQAAAPGAAQAPPAAPAAPAAPPATTIPNPVKPTPESQAHAKKQYGYDCAMCHGETGDGKTDLVKDMKLTMSDLSDPKTLADKKDGEIFDIIKNGKGQMTAEGDRVKSDDIWNLVIYVRSLAKKS